MIKRIFQVTESNNSLSSVLLLLRTITGIAMMMHGWSKIQNPFGWMPADGPMHIPASFQFLAALSEFAGGAALILGFLNPVTNLGIAITMIVAVYFHMIVRGDPFVNPKGGSYELALVYLGINILFIVTGPGKFSVDRLLFGKSSTNKGSD